MTKSNVRYQGDIKRTFRFDELGERIIEEIPLNGKEGSARPITENDIKAFGLSPNHAGRWLFRPFGGADYSSAGLFIVYQESLTFIG